MKIRKPYRLNSEIKFTDIQYEIVCKKLLMDEYLFADNCSGKQVKHDFIYANRHIIAENMIKNTAADDCRNHEKYHNTQFSADVHTD